MLHVDHLNWLGVQLGCEPRRIETVTEPSRISPKYLFNQVIYVDGNNGVSHPFVRDRPEQHVGTEYHYIARTDLMSPKLAKQLRAALANEHDLHASEHHRSGHTRYRSMPGYQRLKRLVPLGGDSNHCFSLHPGGLSAWHKVWNAGYSW